MKKCAVIALAGAPNAGKSTLLNALIGAKISIVSPKVQTTRTRVSGILTEGDTQLVFVDIPGIFKPSRALEKAMVRHAWGSLQDVDAIGLLIDARKGISQDVSQLIEGLAQRDGKKILIINKIDKVKKEELLALAQELNQLLPFEHSFMISALKGDGVADLQQFFMQHAPGGEWLFPKDQQSDMPDKLFAAEVTREKLMLALDQELPYRLMVETEKWDEDDKKIMIHQLIYVTQENHKKIVIGKGGQTLKRIGEQSRKELSYLFDKRVSVFLHVKVDEGWLESPERYRLMGLELKG